MKVGTTSILLVNLDVDVSKISKIIWTLKSDNSTITKEYPDDVTYADGYFGIPLTQENTSALGAGIVKVEGQVNYTDKAVAKTVTAYTTIADTLATETVTGNRPNGETDITELHVKLVGEAIIAYTDGSGGGTTSEIDDNTTTLGNTWSASKINSDYNKTNNFKTINNQSIIGTGNISISGGGSGTDVLAGKKILFVGDSICEGVGASGKPYPYWIQLWHPNATVYNLGQGGMSLCNPNNRENSLPYRIQNGVFTQYNGNVDYIILQGGINDTAYKMGWIRSTETSARTIPNTTQIWSALEYAVMYFRENNPSARIMFMSTHRPPGYTNKNWFDLLWEGCSEVCHKWGIEYIDLYSLISSNYVPNLQLHPTEEQHKLYYAPIINSCLCGQTFCAGSTQTHAYNCDSLIGINFYSGTTSFNVGDTFSTSDWRINRVYDANYRMQGGAVTNNCYFDSSNVNMNVEGTYYVYVSYTENGRSASCVVEITVGATTRTLTSISATKSITSYTVGDDYSVSDVTVTASYSDGTTTDVTSDSTIDASNINKNIAGTYLINCSYIESGVTKYDSISVEYADAQTWTKTVEVPQGSKVVLINYGDYYSTTDAVVLNPSTTNVTFDYELTVYDDSGNVVSTEYKLGTYDRYNGRAGTNHLSNLQNRFGTSYSKTYTSTSINAGDFVLTNYNTSYRCVIKMKNINVSITSSN